ncbi:MAG: hypothetical protein AAF602_29525, partial [Myxococcota bacterium]
MTRSFVCTLLLASACTGLEPLPPLDTSDPGPVVPTVETDAPTFAFDVPAEAFAAFRADENVTLGSNDEVTAWTDLGGTLTAALTPPGDEGIQIFVDGSPSLDFRGTSNLMVDLGKRLTDATVFVRFRYDATESDNDYLYAIGDAEIDTPGGTQMSLSRGNFAGDGNLDSYHYTGKDELLGGRIQSDAWYTSRQVYLGTAQEAGTSHHTLFLDGQDALMDLSDAPYDVQGTLAIGNWLEGDFRLVNAEIRGLVIFDRLLTDEETAAT